MILPELVLFNECCKADSQSKDLIGLLQRSPESLEFAPRVVYTSSRTGEYSALPPNIHDDYQLIKSTKSYGASKYLGNLIMSRLDREYGPENSKSTSMYEEDAQDDRESRKVRFVTADPGSVRTNVANASLTAASGGFAAYVAFMRFANLAVFWLVSARSYLVSISRFCLRHLAHCTLTNYRARYETQQDSA
jgi:NAD(P)-dependent dehydrogenase (short-subunit alcohol dehydrogenase family)